MGDLTKSKSLFIIQRKQKRHRYFDKDQRKKWTLSRALALLETKHRSDFQSKVLTILLPQFQVFFDKN